MPDFIPGLELCGLFYEEVVKPILADQFPDLVYDAGLFGWPEFQAALIARIAAWEADPPPGQPWSYYQHWLGALEDVLAGLGTVATEEITVRAAELAHRPAGHDHREPHQH